MLLLLVLSFPNFQWEEGVPWKFALHRLLGDAGKMAGALGCPRGWHIALQKGCEGRRQLQSQLGQGQRRWNASSDRTCCCCLCVIPTNLAVLWPQFPYLPRLTAVPQASWCGESHHAFCLFIRRLQAQAESVGKLLGRTLEVQLMVGSGACGIPRTGGVCK